MEKLDIKDIKPIKPRKSGYYVKNEILNKYGSLEVFANEINIYKESLVKYLDSSKLGSDTFKFKVVQHLDKGMNDIVVTKENQIRGWVDAVTNNLDMYKSSDDMKLMQKIKGYCLRSRMHLETAKMLRNTAMINFYNGKAQAAIELLKLSIEMLENEYKMELVFEYTSELGLVYFYEHEYKRARELMEKIEFIQNKYELSEKILHLYYYRLGHIFRLMNKYKEAREMLEKAFRYGDNNYFKGNALMNIGIILKNEKMYNKALENYLDTYNYFDKDDSLSISILENNIAELYKEMGELDKAVEYIDKALLGIGASNIQKRFVYTQTYVQIKILEGKPEEGIQRLMNLISYCKNVFLYKNHIVEGVEILVSYALDKKDLKVMHRLEQEILNLIKNAKGESRYVIELKALLCDIYIYYRRREGLI